MADIINPERRNFFKLGLRKTTQTAVKGVDILVRQQAQHWIRPPYAIDELEFLLACTRCGACVAACPHQVIFNLPARRGAKIVNTPAMDLLHKGCHLCADWPCVESCEPSALKLPKTKKLPKLAIASINQANCLPYSGPECGACANSCQIPGALGWDGSKPHIEPNICIGCALCREACVVEPNAIEIKSLDSVYV